LDVDVNALLRARRLQGEFYLVVGDAQNIPFKSNCIDLCYSNSCLEHIGDFAKQLKAIREMKRVGRNIFIQVPFKYFPIDAHYLIPLFQLLPFSLQRKISNALFGYFEEVFLVTKREIGIILREFSFGIYFEKFCLWKKSVIFYTRQAM